jgi:hypothetical protein
MITNVDLSAYDQKNRFGVRVSYTILGKDNVPKVVVEEALYDPSLNGAAKARLCADNGKLLHASVVRDAAEGKGALVFMVNKRFEELGWKGSQVTLTDLDVQSN